MQRAQAHPPLDPLWGHQKAKRRKSKFQLTPLQALLEEVLSIIKFRRWKGLEFSQEKREYTFDEIPALTLAGWTEERYLQEKQADERSFEE